MLGNGNGIYFSSRSGGPCWSRDQGYHHPAPLPDHIVRIITSPRPRSPQAQGESLPADDSHSGQPHNEGGDTK